MKINLLKAKLKLVIKPKAATIQAILIYMATITPIIFTIPKPKAIILPITKVLIITTNFNSKKSSSIMAN